MDSNIRSSFALQLSRQHLQTPAHETTSLEPMSPATLLLTTLSPEPMVPQGVCPLIRTTTVCSPVTAVLSGAWNFSHRFTLLPSVI